MPACIALLFPARKPVTRSDQGPLLGKKGHFPAVISSLLQKSRLHW